MKTEESTTIFAAISGFSVIADDVRRVPVADPMPLEVPQRSQCLVPGSPVRILAAENSPHGLADQLATRSALSLSSAVYLFEKFICGLYRTDATLNDIEEFAAIDPIENSGSMAFFLLVKGGLDVLPTGFSLKKGDEGKAIEDELSAHGALRPDVHEGPA